MSWLFGDSSTSKPTETIVSTGRQKRRVVEIDTYNNFYGNRVDRFKLDAALCKLMQDAELYEDADEVIACLNDSPRFKRHLCRVAEEKLEAKRKELAEAEVYAQKVCRV